MATAGTDSGVTAAAVLARVRRDRAAEFDHAARVLESAVAWAALHPADETGAMPTQQAAWGETGLAIAGEGAPVVAEFCLVEFAAALGISTEAGKRLVGEALELAHRLPRLWALVGDRAVPPWQARRVAQATTTLTAEAAAFVDVHAAAVAGRVGPVQLDRLVEEAIARFMPETLQARRRREADSRHLDLDTRQVDSQQGTVGLHGVLDLADGLDLDHAIGQEAAALTALGSTESLDVRRSRAIARIARRQLALDLEPHHGSGPGAEADGGGDAERDAPGDGRGPRPRTRRPRQVVLYAHLAAEAITGGPGGGGLARVENLRRTLSVDQVRAWCADPDAQVVVRPVLDLASHHHTEAYQIPDRLAEQTRLRHPTCVFPWCTRQARACDLDHTVAHRDGGATCTGNLAPLCRRHHRAKTHGGWHHQAIGPTGFVWTSPMGAMYHRDHIGTTRITPAGEPHTGPGCPHPDHRTGDRAVSRPETGPVAGPVAGPRLSEP